MDTIIQEQKRVLAHREYLAKNSTKEDLKKFSAEKVDVIKNEIAWVEKNRALIESQIR